MPRRSRRACRARWRLRAANRDGAQRTSAQEKGTGERSSMHTQRKPKIVWLLAWSALCTWSCSEKPEVSSVQAAETQTPPPAAKTIRVGIGTQDTTINCATGGPIVRELHLLEKYLPHTGKYENVKYDILWENQPTGAQLNSKYLANQLDIVQMADFPSVLGATALAAAGDQVRSLYIATLSGGIHGAGNAIVVPANSSVQSLSE